MAKIQLRDICDHLSAAAEVEGIVDALATLPALEGYHLLPAVRADFLTRLGRRDEARAELERAAALTKNDRERELLLRRAAATRN